MLRNINTSSYTNSISTILLLLILNCKSLSSYTKDRGSDLLDSGEISVGYNPLSFLIPSITIGIGTASFGIKTGATTSIGLENGTMGIHESKSVIIGIAIYEEQRTLSLDGIEEKYMFRNKSFCVESNLYTECRGKGKPSSAKYTRISFEIGWLALHTRIAINPGELADFFLGFVGIDLYGDDYYESISH